MKGISQTTQFARDIKKMRKRGKNLAKLEAIVRQLAAGISLDPTETVNSLCCPDGSHARRRSTPTLGTANQATEFTL